MGASAFGIGSVSAVPCVGDPATWDATWFTCPEEGALSLLALTPAGNVMDPGPDICEEAPVLVHVTVCQRHARAVRKFLRKRTSEPIDTYPTQHLLEHWGQVRECLEDTPVWRMQRAV